MPQHDSTTQQRTHNQSSNVRSALNSAEQAQQRVRTSERQKKRDTQGLRYRGSDRAERGCLSRQMKLFSKERSHKLDHNDLAGAHDHVVGC